MTVRFADGRDEVLIGDQLDSDHLDHAYALTVHRVQGATVDTAHVFADGGGRELAYVAMSRARARTHVYVTADDDEQASEDLVAEWSLDRRQRWTIDVDRPAEPGQPTRPNLARRATRAVRLAQLVAERDAVAAIAPEETRRIEALDVRVRLTRLEVPAQRGLGLAR
jgi:ATP-dependent exoDNAse (exonuclease V) alpha subunit